MCRRIVLPREVDVITGMNVKGYGTLRGPITVYAQSVITQTPSDEVGRPNPLENHMLPTEMQKLATWAKNS